MERFMRMEEEQMQAAQMHSLAADELSALIPVVSHVADIKGELSSKKPLFDIMFPCFKLVYPRKQPKPTATLSTTMGLLRDCYV